MELQSIVILDFGSQFTQLIARRIREQNVFSVVLPCTAPVAEIESYRPVGIILSGGPCSVYDTDAPPADQEVLHLDLPVLGICYGLQWMTHQLGGKVVPGKTREYGHAQVQTERDSQLFRGLPRELKVWMSHGDEARELAHGFHLVARSGETVAAIEDPNPQVQGKGFQVLRAAGIEVNVGVAADEARALNEAFARFIRTRLPLVTLKTAMTLDGRIAPPPGESVNPTALGAGTPTGGWITSEIARVHVQDLRHAADAIMVGVGTVIADDPLLTDRTGLPRLA